MLDEILLFVANNLIQKVVTIDLCKKNVFQCKLPKWDNPYPCGDKVKYSLSITYKNRLQTDEYLFNNYSK